MRECFFVSGLISLVLWIAVMTGGRVAAQSPVTVRLSLQAAVDSAMANNTLILRYRQAVAEKEQMRRASRGNYFPSVDVMGGYTYLSKNPEVNMSKMKESVDQMFGYYGAHIANELGLSDETQEQIYQRIVSRMGQLPA